MRKATVILLAFIIGVFAFNEKEIYKKDIRNRLVIQGVGIDIETDNSYGRHNGISLGMDIGQKASVRNNMIRERYVMFVIAFNIHDLWFIKNQYN